MKDKNFTIEATGEFPFTFFIEKAIAGGTEEKMTIKGIASTVNIDHDNERMSPESLVTMAEVINDKGVPLRVEHQKDDNAVVGKVNKAWVDERNQLWIEADLDKSHPAASVLYKSLKEGMKLGLSVGGRVKHAVKEFSESAGKMIKTFYQVMLDEVSVTSRPANYDAWLFAKSIIKDMKDDTSAFEKSSLYREFLFENPGLDYMQSFAKSIPDKSWKRVDLLEDNLNKTMETEEEKKKKAQDESETKEKGASETETKEKDAEMTDEDKKPVKEEGKEDVRNKSEEAFKSFVIKGFESLTNMMAKLAKGSDKEETTIMEEKDESKTKEKAASETETKEKDMEDSETKEKAGTETSKSMSDLLKRMENLSKGEDTMTDEEKKKSEDKEETTEKSSIDTFVGAMETVVKSLETRYAAKGQRVPGLTSEIVAMIRNDSEIQKSIKDMMKEAGPKKSVSFGAPFMKSKDGKMYRLTAETVVKEESVEKNTAAKTFKDVYQKNFSSTANAVEE